MNDWQLKAKDALIKELKHVVATLEKERTQMQTQIGKMKALKNFRFAPPPSGNGLRVY